jgi:hypothetical protein
VDLFRFIPGYTEHIYDLGKEPLLLIFIAFLVTFGLTRGYTRLARARRWGSGSVGGVHLHHAVPGIILVLVGGLLLAAPFGAESPGREIIAIVFGAGAALVLDEFALIFHLQDVYWSNQGRGSIDAVIMGAALGGILLVSSSPWGIDEEVTGGHLPKLILFALFASHLLFATVCYLKGKHVVGTLGIFMPLVALTGALRLAKPSSPWAHRLYDERRLARARDRNQEGRTGRFENWFVDLIGGKPSQPDPPRSSSAS